LLLRHLRPIGFDATTPSDKAAACHQWRIEAIAIEDEEARSDSCDSKTRPAFTFYKMLMIQVLR